MARLLVQTGLPHSRRDSLSFVRTNGSLQVSISAHPLLGLPYGRYPRLLMAWVTTEAVRTKEPITEGFVSLLEPFIDTVVICTMTALVITISGQLMIDPATGNYIVEGSSIKTIGDTSGVALTSAAFASAFSWFPYVLAIAVILFAFSTMISWSYYGLKAWTYMFGEGKAKELVFKIIFCVFVVIGAAANLGPVIDFSDAAIFAMAVVNISALYVLMPIVKKELNSYLSRLKSGEIKKFTH